MRTARGFLVALTLVVLVPSSASASKYIVHVGGMCSQYFTDPNAKGGGGRVASVSGYISIDARVDMRNDDTTAVNQVKSLLDTYCTGGHLCRLYGYSNGGYALTRALQVYGNYQWNIEYIMNTGSNEGGSELASTGWIAEVFGGCSLASKISPSAHRNGHNHNDTDGETVYQLAGYKCFAQYGCTTSTLLPGEDDGAVAMHSAGGYATTGSWNDACQSGRWTNHVAVYWCRFYLDHYAMKMRGITCMEAGSCASN